ncbi:hypothetical protein JTB14_006822 [Gonioctena quinquepunctata]|nr:hypothetical protein JTB14_006822 [Gonioctena quinquepunctata]
MPQKVPFKRRFNLRKADWYTFTEDIDEEIRDLTPTPASYDNFISAIKKTARCCIPRGCRTYYIPGFYNESKDTYEEYLEHYSRNPFSLETSQLGVQLTDSISGKRQEAWKDTIESMDMRHSSRKARSLIKKLTGDPSSSKDQVNVSVNEIAHQLLLNGKPDQNVKVASTLRMTQQPRQSNMAYFTITELETVSEDQEGPRPRDILIVPDKLRPIALNWLLQSITLAGPTTQYQNCG